ncbi:MAG: sensor histidine kinase [Syntrophobacteraceae bacterium]
MPDGGSLFFSTSFDAAKNLIRLKVKDSGCGISRNDLPYIFDPFYTTKKEGKGVGLGLSTTFGIIDRHKGTIQVKSAPGQGAEFVIELPVNAADPPASIQIS